ncbi:MAG: rhomboid family intramembrane serine protease [Bacteroidia bacterium]|nr:MAG: rhomboid family intramembrane serine protease [Bacteroidia bacterium]
MKLYNKTWYQLSNSNYLTSLLVLNFTLFVLVNLFAHLLKLDLTTYLAMPLNEYELIYKPWTLLTYMFLHLDFFHLLFNLLLLYFTGTLFQSILGEKRLLYLYIMSGLSGALFLLITQFLIPSLGGGYLLGASASVMGIIAAQAIYTPNYIVHFFFVIQMPFKYFALITFILSTLIDFSFNTGGKITHVGGAMFGLIYALYLKKGIDLKSISIFKNKKQPSYSSKKRFKDEDEYLDYLLDKISTKGYHSLTKQEKEDLFKISQKK